MGTARKRTGLKGFSKIGTLLLDKKSSLGFLTPRFYEDVKRALGKFWNLSCGFYIHDGILTVTSTHPAVAWEVRLRKREILEHLKDHGIKDIRIQGRNYGRR